MTKNLSDLNAARRQVHLAEAEFRFSLFRYGNLFAEKFGYGSLDGLTAIARFLLERDGTPIYETLSLSAEAIHSQIDGVIDEGFTTVDKDKLSPLEAAAYRLMLAEAELASLLDLFGDELARKHGLGVDGLDAIRLHLVHKHNFKLAWLESLRASELRKYLEKEMDGWTVKV